MRRVRQVQPMGNQASAVKVGQKDKWQRGLMARILVLPMPVPVLTAGRRVGVAVGVAGLRAQGAQAVFLARRQRRNPDVENLPKFHVIVIAQLAVELF